ncbi:F-box protein At3g07870-like [Primulina huaijiensis]|uniref:F-box protein At3g07870-like n=1 Tax=Primulina huaijiensis TaxID=1492673 RepID=UPI003CC6E5E6
MNSLPSEIIACILSRLPIRTIVICKHVCKRWLDILSAPEFAKCHLSLSNPGLITHQFEEEDLWKVIEFEDVLELQNHDLHYNLVKKFDPRSFITSPDARIVIEGSVDGFLFLRDFSTRLDSLYICNPITREYIALPQPKFVVQNAYNSHYGFGLSSISGQYKVIWNNYHETRSCSNLQGNSVECLVYTLGTGSWRSVALGDPIQTLRSSMGVFLNGNLHWLAQDFNGHHLISCFDLETEIFEPFSPLPPYPRIFPDSRSLVVLQDCLCLCEYSTWDTIVIWMMKDYRVNESWSQQYVIPIMFRTTCETMYPIKVFKDGDILILWEDFELFFYSNKSKSTQKVDAFEMVHYSGWTEATLHTSSFVSLKSFCVENVGIF